MRSGVKKIKFDYAYNDDKTIIIITIKLHRLLMGVAETQLDMVVDHIDGNGLNMLENNLRLITKTENSKNKHFNKKDREINNYAKYTV